MVVIPEVSMNEGHVNQSHKQNRLVVSCSHIDNHSMHSQSVLSPGVVRWYEFNAKMVGQHKRIIAAVGEDAFAAETTRRMPLVLDDAGLYAIATPLGFQMTWLTKGKAKARSVVTVAGGDIATVLAKAGPPPASVGVIAGGAPPAMAAAAAPGIVPAVPPPSPAMRPVPAGQSAPVAAAAAVPMAMAPSPAVVPVAPVATPMPWMKVCFRRANN